MKSALVLLKITLLYGNEFLICGHLFYCNYQHGINCFWQFEATWSNLLLFRNKESESEESEVYLQIALHPM